MKLNLDDLTHRQAHHLQPIFSKYDRTKLAHAAGISVTYFGHILTGYYVPSEKIELKLSKLARDIERAELERAFLAKATKPLTQQAAPDSFGLGAGGKI